MTRQEVDDCIVDYLYDEMDAAERARFEAALVQYPDLQAEVSSSLQLRELVAGEPDEPLPDRIAANIMEQARLAVAPPPQPGWWERLWLFLMQPQVAVAVAAVLLAGVGLLLLRQPGGEQQGATPTAEQVAMAPSAAPAGMRAAEPYPAELEEADELATREQPATASAEPMAPELAGGSTGELRATGRPFEEGEATDASEGDDKRVAKLDLLADSRDELGSDTGGVVDGETKRGGSARRARSKVAKKKAKTPARVAASKAAAPRPDKLAMQVDSADEAVALADNTRAPARAFPAAKGAATAQKAEAYAPPPSTTESESAAREASKDARPRATSGPALPEDAAKKAEGAPPTPEKLLSLYESYMRAERYSDAGEVLDELAKRPEQKKKVKSLRERLAKAEKELAERREAERAAAEREADEARKTRQAGEEAAPPAAEPATKPAGAKE